MARSSVRIDVEFGQARRLLNKLERRLNDEQKASLRRSIVQESARQTRDDIRQKVASGGRGKWKPLTASTKKRKGGNARPLTRLAPLFKFRTRQKGATGRIGRVFFDAPSTEWGIDQHDQGYSVGAVRDKLMAYANADGSFSAFRNRKAFSVPARPIWPTEQTMKRTSASFVRRFIAEWERKI